MGVEQSRGVIYGLAIGDALGKPTEFRSLARIRSEYGMEGIQKLPDPALYTDDTQMSLAIAEALVTAGNQDLETIMTTIREQFILWSHHPDTPSRAPGTTCLTGVSNMELGVHWSKSGVSHSKGCGSAMRSAPIGYMYQNDPAKLREVAHASGICTHGHPTADAACIGAAYLVKLALDHVSPDEMVGDLLRFTAGISREFDTAIERVNTCLDWEDEIEAMDLLGQGWIGEEAVALGLYCFLRYPNSYDMTVIRGANSEGDSDSIACIAGSISGAYLGSEAIPLRWRRQIENSAQLDDLACRLAAKKTSL